MDAGCCNALRILLCSDALQVMLLAAEHSYLLTCYLVTIQGSCQVPLVQNCCLSYDLGSDSICHC